ncbi:MAG: fatty acyl-AMP ligase [Scytonematopsis contorta HA4267-MV1]|jgi:acyl-CoA synthetase (AMP-forming)/AMP-acid ligase II|nr:fatty acyl-AMP ligase [Scytonematopsis contorta HA4267-MV1]
MTTCLTGLTEIGQELSTVSTLVDLLRFRVLNQPNLTAYTFLLDGETETLSLTYAELDRQARVIAIKLRSMNVAGSRALLLYPPGLDFIAAFFGCLYAGVVAIPAYPPRANQNMSRLQSIVSDAQATLALTTTSLLDNINSSFATNSEFQQLCWLATDSITSITSNLAEEWQEPSLSGSNLAFLQYTSGSTGTPKGVMVSHSNILHNLGLIKKSFADTPKSRGVSWLPPYHDMGLIGGVLQPLYVGAEMILMSPLAFMQKPLRWLKAISRFQVTTSGGPNFAYDLCIRKTTPEQRASLDLSSWEVAFTGAEPIRAETLTQFVSTFADCGFRMEAFHPCYGMAETTLIVSGSVKSSPPIISYLDGVALEKNQVVAVADKRESTTREIVSSGGCLGQKVLIVEPESLTTCPDNQIGEIWVSSPSVAGGYWNNSELTQQTFQAYVSDTGEGPFLRTGDLGFLKDGELFITGRIKDVIIIRGQNHYPQDIELTVEKSHPALKTGSGAAFTVEARGKEQLVIVQEIERNYLRKLNVNEVVGNISQAIAAEHGLQIYAAVLVKTGSIPKTSSGKIQRYACRTGFLNGTLNVVEDWSENPQSKAKFLDLQAEVESVLQKLS